MLVCRLRGWKEDAGEIGVCKGGDCEQDCILECASYHEQTLKVSEGRRSFQLSHGATLVRAKERLTFAFSCNSFVNVTIKSSKSKLWLHLRTATFLLYGSRVSSVGFEPGCRQDDWEIAGLNPENDLDISENSEQEEIRRIKNAA